MGKQTKRQKAKKARDAVPECPDPETPNLCCLPHCEEAGEKLECGHSLCGVDFLKLTRYVSQLKQFTITCPMCRKWGLLKEDLVKKAMDQHLPFKSAVFKCGCVEKDCKRSFTGVLKPCKSHSSYVCGVCVDRKASRLTMTDLENSEESESDDEPWWDIPGWGISDEVFERLLRGTGVNEAQANVYRNERRLGRRTSMPELPYNTPGWGMSDAEFEQFLQQLEEVMDLNQRNEQEHRRARQEGRYPNWFQRQTSRRPRARNPLITIPMSEVGPMMDRGDRILVPPDQVEDFMRAVSAVRGR